jgi:cytoskeletal protein CcmA (bactofilin family)
MSFFSRALAKFAFLQTRLGFGREAQARQSMTLICAGACLRGAIEAPGSLRVEGNFQGDARALGTIEVVKGAEIAGTELHCQELVIAGLVESRVVATGSVTIVSGGCLRGDLTCHSLSIARGAEFHGQVSLSETGSKASMPGSPYRTQVLDGSPAGVDLFA